MKHSSTLGKLYDAPEPFGAIDDDEHDGKTREQEVAKMSWLRETPGVLANRIPNSVFALGDMAGSRHER